MRFLSFFYGILFTMLPAVEAQPGFPEGWLGEWAGELEIFRAAEKVQSVPMLLTIQPLGEGERISWSTLYHPEKSKLEKSYHLLAVDSSQGYYLLDERNSIRLETYLLGKQKLVSWYAAGESLLLASYECGASNSSLKFWQAVRSR